LRPTGNWQSPDYWQSTACCFSSAFEWLPESAKGWQNQAGFQHKDHKFTFAGVTPVNFYKSLIILDIFNFCCVDQHSF